MVDNNVDEEIIIEEDNREEEVAVVYENLSLAGTTDYLDLANKPRINDVELIRNQTSNSLGLQDTLVSGENIKTINDQSILGSGNIEIQGGGSSDYNDLDNKPSINGVELENNKSLDDLDIQSKLISGVTIKTINYNSLLGSGNIDIQGGGLSDKHNVIFKVSPGLVPILICNLAPDELVSLTPENAKVSIVYGDSTYICTYWNWVYNSYTSGISITLKFESTNNNTTTYYTCTKAADIASCDITSYTISNYDDTEITNDIETIESKIPDQATSSNQLADKAFVNSTVQTGTANFRGNWQNWASVPIDATEYPQDYTGSTTPTTNDYMVVQDVTGYVDPQTTLVGTWRFKYSGVWSTDGRNGWHPEYQVNETPMTAAQLAALNSGATSSLIEQISRNEDSIYDLQSEKQDALVSGTNIKTINNQSILSSGNITIPTVWDGTLAQYNAITTKDASTIYLIHD